MKKILVVGIGFGALIASAMASATDTYSDGTPVKMGWFNGQFVQCRNPAQKHKFDLSDGHPHGDPSTRVDHGCALKCGGKDDLVNMNRQTIKDSFAKDLWENTPEGCAKTCTPLNSTYPVRKVFNCNGKKDELDD